MWLTCVFRPAIHFLYFTFHGYRKNIFEDFLYRSIEQGGTRKRFPWILIALCESTTWNYPKTAETAKLIFLPLRVSRFRNLILLNSQKFSLNFRNIHSQKFSWNFNKFFQKFPEKVSQDLDKILFENCSNSSYSLPKIFRKFFLFCRISTYFLKYFITSHFRNQLIKFSKSFIKIYDFFFKF